MKKNTIMNPPLSEEIKKKIIERWRHSPLNSILQLALEFNCPDHQIHSCINNYLATKIKS